MYIGVDCSPDDIREYTDLFKEFRDLFSRSYQEMSGINPCIIEDEIETYPDAKPV